MEDEQAVPERLLNLALAVPHLFAEAALRVVVSCRRAGCGDTQGARTAAVLCALAVGIPRRTLVDQARVVLVRVGGPVGSRQPHWELDLF